MKILITGSTGMVGRNLIDAFSESQHELLTPSRHVLNLFDSVAIRKYLDKTQPDFIIHCAGKVGGIQANCEDPIGFYIENLDINRNIIFSAYQVGIPNFINLGSACMYPRDAQNPLKEAQLLSGKLEPTNEGYAIAKLSAQRLCHYISETNIHLKYKTLIPCNLYGLYDKFDLKRAHLIPAIIHKMAIAKKTNEKNITIWGNGKCRREFMYAGNLADFILKKIACFDRWPNTMNVGVGKDHTIFDYYNIAKLVLNFTGDFKYDLEKPVGMNQKLLDVTAQENLGWSPSTSLDQGIELTYQYFKNQEQHYLAN